MVKRILRFIRPVALLFAVCLLASTSRANMDTMMGNMFNGVLMNGTPGGVYITQSRGVIAGPSGYMRTKISNVQLMNLSLPSIKADCGGIDAYLGSFSFISKEQLVTFLRQTAQAAIPYAFKVALKALCNPCDDVMQTLQSLSNFVNQSNLNSCQAAKIAMDESGLTGLISGTASKIRDQFRGGEVATKAGATQDFQEAKSNPVRSALGTVARDAPASLPEVTGNITWKILARSQLSNWYGTTYSGSGSASIQETIMSLVGSRIRGYVYYDPAEPTPVNRPLIPLVSFRDFIDGGPAVEMYSCNGATLPDECLDPIVVSRPIKGFRAMVKETLQRIKLKVNEVDVSTLSDPDKIFLTNAPGAVGAHIVGLSVNSDAVDYYLNVASDYIAIEVAGHFVQDVYKSISAAGSKEYEDPEIGFLLDRLERINAELGARMQDSYARLGAIEKNIQIVQLMRASLNTSPARNRTVFNASR